MKRKTLAFGPQEEIANGRSATLTSAVGQSWNHPLNFSQILCVTLSLSFPLMKQVSQSGLISKHTPFHLDLDLLPDTLNLAFCQSGLAYAKRANGSIFIWAAAENPSWKDSSFHTLSPCFLFLLLKTTTVCCHDELFYKWKYFCLIVSGFMLGCRIPTHFFPLLVFDILCCISHSKPAI